MPTQLADSADFERSDTLQLALDAITDRLGNTGFYFDFDGTLAEIQDDPQTVQPVPGVMEALSALSGNIGRIGIISARNASFLCSRFGGLKGVQLYGLYGLEEIGADGTVVVGPEATPWIGVIEELLERALRELPGDVYVEDKGLSLGLHYRRAPHTRSVIEKWADVVAAQVGVQVQQGRMVVELKPPISTDKGTILESHISELSAAWYFGDDVGDLPAYAVLHERARADGSFSALAIAVGNDEAIDDVIRTADIIVSSPSMLVELLRYVARYLTSVPSEEN
ncbi:MAG: trehalose-phosphatase [Pseudonocardiaceae bacterium]